MQPVQSAAELCQALPAVIAEVVGAPNHVQQVVPTQRRTDDALHHVEGMFLPDSYTVVLKGAIVKHFSEFFEKAAGSNHIANEEREKWMISIVKGDLALVLHEVAHGFGPQQPELLAIESNEYWHNPTAMMWNEGFCELISRQYLNEVITRMGLDTVDSRITEIPAIRTRFNGPYEIVNAMVQHSAEQQHVSVDTVISRIAARGASELALWNVAMMWNGEDATVGTAAVTKETFDTVLSSYTHEWLGISTTAHDIAGEEKKGHDVSSRLSNSVQRAVNRFHSSGDILDVALLGELLTTAGVAASTKTTNGFDAMQEALSLMEFGEI